MIKKTITLLSLSACLFICKAQSTTNSAGATVSASSGNVSYSVGQVFYNSNVGQDLSITEGVQQPYEIIEVLGVDVTEIGLNMKIFPNPTQDILNLRVDFSDFSKYRYELYDSSNKIILNKPINSRNIELSIASYPSALYYLKVIKSNKVVKVFKVLKIDK